MLTTKRTRTATKPISHIPLARRRAIPSKFARDDSLGSASLTVYCPFIACFFLSGDVADNGENYTISLFYSTRSIVLTVDIQEDTSEDALVSSFPVRSLSSTQQWLPF
jgi:hypothetical protein